MRGLGLRSMATSLPGRETGRLDPERAAPLLREATQAQDHVAALTIVDTAPALKVLSELLGLTARARAAAKP
jgi:hypothetical protein